MSHLHFDGGPVVQAGQQKVLLATTAYQSPDAAYTASVQGSRMALTEAGIPSAYLLLSGNCHVDDARNVVVQEFLLSDCTDLVFLDADVSWEPDDLVRLCRPDEDMVGAVYPYRDPDREGVPCRTIKGAEPDARGLLEMDGLPTGFLRIRRRVFETLAQKAATFRNRGDNRAPVPILFERSLLDDGRFSGDLHFCRKWREAGGTLWADPEIVLGHTARVVVRDSLGAALRRQRGETLRWVVDRVRRGSEAPRDYKELRKAIGGKWSAEPPELAAAVLLARKCTGPIIEAGSGLTTLLMAAANPSVTVYCLEHDPIWAEYLRRWCAEAAVTNIDIDCRPLVDGWYDLRNLNLPRRFSLGLIDGPPRAGGSRGRFLDVFGERTTVMLADDADDPAYALALADWVRERGGEMDLVSLRGAMLTGYRRSEREAA